MALTDTTFILVPNEFDGRQRLSDPFGTLEPVVSGLQPVTGLQITDTTSGTQTLVWQHDENDGVEGYRVDIWIANQDDTWRYLDARAVGTKTYTSSGLPADRYIRYRVSAWINGTPAQYSAWTEVDGNTLQSSGSGTETNLLALTFFYNFEHLDPDENIHHRGDGFGACAHFTCDANKQAAAPGGTRCGHTYLVDDGSADGTTGYGEWGYDISEIPQPLEGAEVWWRKAIFWPNGAYYGSSGALLKQMRFRRRTLSGADNRGSTEVGLDSQKRLALSIESVDHWTVDDYGYGTTGHTFKSPDAVMPFGRWVWFESYVKFYKDPNLGEVAVWLDGKPAGRVTCPTMCRPSDGVDVNFELLMASYWNGGVAGHGYCEQWYDQIAVAQQGPVIGGTANDLQYLAEDDDGYPFIGTAYNTDKIRT